MASTYLRSNSPFVWLRFKEGGKWKSKVTPFRKDDRGDLRAAEVLARRESVTEREAAPAEHGWEWVDLFISKNYEGSTLRARKRSWERWREFLAGERIGNPSQFRYVHLNGFREMRERDIGINTVLNEIKIMSAVMAEAIRREFAEFNPCLRMGFKRTKAKEKQPWSDDEVRTVAAALGSQPDWMRASFVLGYYQAARLRQAEVPLRDIDLNGLRITYWKTIDGRPLVKGDRPFSQPIAQAAVPALLKLVQARQAGGFKALCEIPGPASIQWRRFLLTLGLGHLCHHGLRVTWITKAAQSRKITRAEAMRFVNHGSSAVHAIYQRLNADDIALVADALHLPALDL